MTVIKSLWPTKAAFLHLRLAFSFFLLPIFLFALSAAPTLNWQKTTLIFLVWHFLVYPASNAYNSYFDKDEGSIALLKTPPKTDVSLYFLAIFLEWLAVALALFVSISFAFAVLIYNSISKAYSHPTVRLKKYPFISFLMVFIFQGGFVYLSTVLALQDLTWLQLNKNMVLPAVLSACLVGASYPLTQVYQHEEDLKRGDKTLSILLGVKGSFIFSGLLFLVSGLLMYFYWQQKSQREFFYLFCLFIFPVTGYFGYWFIKVWKDKREANYLNMMRMTIISGSAMFLYFLWVCIAGFI